MKRTSLLLRLSLFACSMILLITSCTKDPNDPGNSGSGGSSGRFSGHMSCTVIAPPADVKLDAYYTKYINCSGVPVIGGDSISDEALILADQTISFMLKGLDDIKANLIKSGCYYALTYSAGLAFNNLPEISGEKESSGGKYQGMQPIAISSEDNLLCKTGNRSPGTNNMVHEVAHMMHDMGMRKAHSSFQSELDAAYSNAKSKGLWANTYGISASQEYLAVGMTVWYGVLKQGKAGGDGWSNEIYTREGLQNYDPDLYAFIAKYFNAERDVPGCVKPTTTVNVNCDPTVTDIDGNVYNVVSIGSQCWMKENLRTSRLNDGTPINKISDGTNWQTKWFDSKVPTYIYYDHNETINETYGKLYNWEAASNSKLCPKGWHIPTNAEWEQMIKQAGGVNDISGLQATTSWNGATGATNKSGFTALAAGGLINEQFTDRGDIAYFWSSEMAAPPFEMLRLGVKMYAKPPLELGGFLPEYGFSCRCVKD